MAAKKKKLTNASASSRPSTGAISLYALKAETQSPLGKKDEIVKRQEDEEAPRTWPFQPPMIEDCSGEKCSGWDSNADYDSGGFLDNDIDFLPTGWGKNDKQSNEDEERAVIVRKARLKNEKSQASAVKISAREKETARVQCRQIDCSRALVRLPKSGVKMEIAESVTRISSNSTEQDVDEGIKVYNSVMSIEDSCVASNSQPLGVVESEIFAGKSTVLETESSIKLVEKMARQERDLKSAKTQANSLRVVIETLDRKHRLEVQKQMDQLSESHRKEMDAVKLDLKEAEATRQKALTDLRKVREKNSAVRAERRELGLKLAAVNEEVARLTGNISMLETQNSDALKMEEFSSYELYKSRQETKAAELSLQAERMHNATLQQQIRDSRSDNSSIRQQQSQLDSTFRRLQELEQKYDSLKDDYYTLEDKYNELDDDAAGYRSELQKYKQYAERCTKRRDTIRVELERVEGRLTDMTIKYVNVLHSRDSIKQIYQELKKIHDLREPLVKIGVDIRLRFLDQAREIALNISRDEVDMVLRTNENIAAHRDNAAADAALFKCNLVPGEYEDKAEKIFQKLYQQKSSEHPVWTGIVERQMDCGATIKATKWSIISETLHEDWRKVWNGLCSPTTISDGVGATRIVELITRLEDSTDEIVDMERSRGRRR